MASSSDAERRQLVKPSKFQAWGVQVVSAVPSSVHKDLPRVVGGAVTTGWAAVALGEGTVHAFPVKTSTLSQPLQAAPKGHTLYHPGLASTCPLVALSSQDQGAHVHVYAANPTEKHVHYVHLWRLGHDEETAVLPRKPQSKLRLPLEDGEMVSCLSSDPLVVGTSWGRLFWCTVTAQPLTLHGQLMEIPSTSMISRFLSSPTIVQDEPIHNVLKLNKDSILSISSLGKLQHWKVSTTVAASHMATFEVFPVANLQEALRANHLDGAGNVQVLRTNCLPHAIDASSFGLNFIVQLTLGGEARVYWLQATLDITDTGAEFELGHAIYLNRFHASEIECVGLITTHEHLSYAAFQYPSLPVTVMALMDDSTVLHEVDLPMKQAPQLVKGTMGRDTVTHGWCAVAASGLGIRGRWTGLQVETATSATPMKRRSRMGSPSDVATLTSHLRSAFWYWYQNSASSDAVMMRLPPSLQKASSEDLEPAILATATQLQHEGDSSSSHNPMEWHTSFIQLLQHGGLYRSLSSQARFALLGIGQELVVYHALYQALADRAQSVEDSFQPHGVVDWLHAIQQDVLENLSLNDDATVRWEKLLALALHQASQYRQDQAGSLYDIQESASPTKLWTHHPKLQSIIMQQLELWQNAASSSRNVDSNRLTTVVRAALSSFAETRDDSVDGDERYHQVKTLGIPLVQQYDGDTLAFELSVRHEYYEGICQICLSHEKDEGREHFRLEPLLSDGSPLMSPESRDVKTGFDFARFVFEWHTDRGLYAHVLNYGRCCPEEVLSGFLQTNSRVRQYQWIPAIRNENLETASQFLVEDAVRPGATLASCNWSLSMAKLSNFIAQEEKVSDEAALQALKQHRTVIDSKMELVQAQKLLTGKSGSDNVDNGEKFLSPETLLSMTIQKLEQSHQEADNVDDSVQLCLIGLAICRSMDGHDNRKRLASHVWAQSLLVDMKSSWMGLIQTQHKANKQALQMIILENTVFGQVLQQYEANTSNGETGRTDPVAYDGSMENLVLEQLGLDAVTQFEMKRLLRIGTHLVLPTERPTSL